jgi:hypothetical protein
MFADWSKSFRVIHINVSLVSAAWRIFRWPMEETDFGFGG